MKKVKCLLMASGLLLTAMAAGQTTLTFRLANPLLYYDGATNYFSFDIQVKAADAGTYLWSGQAILSFNNSALSTSEWSLIRGTLLTGTYGVATNKYSDPTITLSGSPLKANIAWYAPGGNLSQTDFTRFNEITTTYQTLVKVYAVISDNTAVAGIDFDEAGMDGEQSYKLLADPWTALYVDPNSYDAANFTDTYLGRIFATTNGADGAWTQYGVAAGADWTTSVKTSVWDGDASITGGSESKASALRVHSGASLTIPYNGQMTVTGETDVQASGGLILSSDGSGTGSLITGSTTGVASSVSANRYMTTGAWHLVASPLSGQTVASFLTGNANIATSGANRGMMNYDPTTNTWSAFFTDASAGSLGGGKGFFMRTGGDAAVTFTGALQTGAQTASGLTEAKWNCVGNPYTSAIGIADGTTSSVNFLTVNEDNLDPAYGAVYIWNQPDANNGKSGQYTVISNTAPSFTEVQQGQAFMVNMKTGVTAVSFSQSMQLHSTGLALKSANTDWATIRLSSTVNNLTSTTLIAYNAGMTMGLDPTYDAGLLKGGADLAVYTRLVQDNGILFAIQALPDADYDNMVIPVGVDSKTGGEIIFKAEISDLPSEYSVVLEDRLLGTFNTLTNGGDYQTTISTDYSCSNRFYLHTMSTSGISGESTAGSLKAYAVKKIEIHLNGAVGDGTVAYLFDLSGRIVLFQKLTEGNLNIISLPAIDEGIYLLKVKEKGAEHQFKLSVQE